MHEKLFNLSDFLHNGKRTPTLEFIQNLGNDMPTLVKINYNQRVMDRFNGLDLGHIGSGQGLVNPKWHHFGRGRYCGHGSDVEGMLMWMIGLMWLDLVS